MVQKAKIEYVGDYYVFGSEARKLEEKPKRALPKLPKIHLPKMQTVYIDPLAVGGIAVAVIMLAVLIFGAVRLNGSLAEYRQMESYVAQLHRENSELSHEYHTAYDPEEVREIAENYGMIDASDAQRWIIHVAVPQPKAEPTFWENVRWFLSGLFANAKH